MSFEITEAAVGNVVEVHATGKLTRDVYETLVPITEEKIREHGKIRILFIMHDFHGWTVGAAWDDFLFDLRHFNHLERLAIVGETKWEKGMSIFCRPFTTAKIKYFDHTDIAKAREWIEEP
ncbi:MAG: STAS/SEC14 domain-containing protein [Planctomycetaceae bacterium]|nr:STAS/SEC14 domain-containing protein [Planctomycetaceae bacterium]